MRKEGLDDPRAAVGRRADLAGRAPRRRCPAVLLKHLGLADDRGERIVELVADPARSAPSEPNFSDWIRASRRALELLLGQLAVGNVEMDAVDGVDLAILVASARAARRP